MQEYKYISPFTIIYKNSNFFLDKNVLDSYFSYFEDIKEDIIDVSNISVPKEFENNFKEFIDSFAQCDTFLGIYPNIAWFMYYFGYRGCQTIFFSNKDQLYLIDILKDMFPNCKMMAEYNVLCDIINNIDSYSRFVVINLVKETSSNFLKKISNFEYFDDYIKMLTDNFSLTSILAIIDFIKDKKLAERINKLLPNEKSIE